MTFHCHLSGSEAIKSLIEHADAADSSLSSIIGILSGKPKKQLINAPTGGAIGSKKENGRRTHIPSASATKIPSITAKSKTNVSVKKPRGQPLPPSKEVGKTGIDSTTDFIPITEHSKDLLSHPGRSLMNLSYCKWMI